MTYFCFTELSDLLVMNKADVLSSTLMRLKTVKAVCVLYSFSCRFFAQLKQMFLLNMACSICSQLTHLEEPCSCVICINENHAVCNLNSDKMPLRELGRELAITSNNRHLNLSCSSYTVFFSKRKLHCFF